MPTHDLTFARSTAKRSRQQTSIDLRRAAPPKVAFLGQELGRTLAHMHRTNGLSDLLAFNRFSGTDDDRLMGAEWLARRLGAPPPADRVVVTNGTQNALLLAIRTLLAPGETLLAEAMTYPQLRAVADLSGIRLRGVAIDRDGIIPDAFEQICKETRPRALYCVPTGHNPTTALLPAPRRAAIVEIARRYGVTILEDDAQGLLVRDPPATLASMAPESVWYFMGLAKCISMGMRVGYLVAPTVALRQKLIDKFGTMSMWFAAPIHATVAASWIRDGGAARIHGAICEDMAARHDVVRSVLTPDEVDTKPGALHLWLRMPPQWSADDFVAAAGEQGVLVRPGHAFALPATDLPGEGVRVCVGDARSLDELETGLAILARLLRGKPAVRNVAVNQ